jgi:hypothetical protein
MDRSVIDVSMDGSGPLTRSLNDFSTSGFIRDDAPHWSIEPFIPLQIDALIGYLLGRGELDSGDVQPFRQFCGDLDKIMHERSGSYHTRFRQKYIPLDPDNDSRSVHASPAVDGLTPAVDGLATGPGPHEQGTDSSADEVKPTVDKTSARIGGAITLCEEVLSEAGYRRLSQEDLEQCAGIVSQWGVPLHVDFDLFERLVVFARGDVIGTKLRRRLRTMYRRESVSVPIYQRMVVLFQLRTDDKSDERLAASTLHLRMFKNIPKQDVDTLLPGSRVRISGVDHIKIILPSLGGFLISLRKIAQYALLFAALALHWTAILFFLLIGYLVKSVMSYFQTKNRYQLNLTRNLYFQRLDTNAGVGYRMVQQAHRQSSLEAILAYYAILTHGEPISSRRLRRRCERMIREAIDVEFAFRVESAIERLTAMQVIAPEGDRWKLK